MKNTPRKSKPQLEAENEFLKKQLKVNSTTKLGEQLIKSIMWIMIAYFFYLSISEISGKATLFSANLSGDIKVNAELSFRHKILFYIGVFGGLVGVGGILYGLKQKNLKKHVIKKLHPYQEKYETLIDKGRSSSRLTPTGNTRKEDE